MSKTSTGRLLAASARRALAIAAAGMALIYGTIQPLGAASSGGHEISRQHWSFAGMFGAYDRAQLQRGYQVYSENCAACHGIKRVYFRNLAEKGGPEFPVGHVKALAATIEVDDGPNAEGDMFKRPALLSDTFVPPFANDNAARAANNGALPPDLSLMTRARTVHRQVPFYLMPINFLADAARGRQEDGADYLYALLTGYGPVPAYRRDALDRLNPIAAADARDIDGELKPGYLGCVSVTIPEAKKGAAPKPHVCNKIADTMYYNVAFPGQQIAMPPPLDKDVFVQYQDGSGSMEQNSADLTAFLAWAADPTLEKRKSMGFTVIIYLMIMTVLLYLAKRRIWARVDH